MDQNIDILLTRYMLGELSEEEVGSINQWLNASNENRNYFDQFKLIWYTAAELKVESRLDINASWKSFKELAGSQEKSKVRQFIPARWMRVAAIWLVVGGAAATIYRFSRSREVTMLTLQTQNEVRIDTLPDGSVITLNKNTIFSYPKKFTRGLRKVSLVQGEAFFNVAHNERNPFIIDVSGISVKVVGTSFNIKNKNVGAEVIVETGMVQVSNKKLVVKLSAKDKLDISLKGATYKKVVVSDKLYDYYRTNLFIADKTPLWRVTEILSEAYGVKIRIADKKVAGMLLTTTLPAGQLDYNLNIISQTLGVHCIKKGNEFIIR